MWKAQPWKLRHTIVAGLALFLLGESQKTIGIDGDVIAIELDALCIL